MTLFNYSHAFSRNHGLISSSEQLQLQQATVAIAGLGGVGGDYALTLARMGVGRFKIADFDSFELVNFNRQAGATCSSLGRPKVAVMREALLDINPEAQVQVYDHGISAANLDDFLLDVSVVIDAVEFFEIAVHRLLMNRCHQRQIPAIFGVPLGFGVAMVTVTAQGMRFDDYFAIDDKAPLAEQALQFALGCAPAGFHLRYLDAGAVDLAHRQAPSVACACKLAAGMVVTQAVLAILHPSELKALPHYSCFDARLNRLKHGYLWWGNRHPVQRLKAWWVKRLLGLR